MIGEFSGALTARRCDNGRRPHDQRIRELARSAAGLIQGRRSQRRPFPPCGGRPGWGEAPCSVNNTFTQRPQRGRAWPMATRVDCVHKPHLMSANFGTGSVSNNWVIDFAGNTRSIRLLSTLCAWNADWSSNSMAASTARTQISDAMSGGRHFSKTKNLRSCDFGTSRSPETSMASLKPYGQRSSTSDGHPEATKQVQSPLPATRAFARKATACTHMDRHATVESPPPLRGRLRVGGKAGSYYRGTRSLCRTAWSEPVSPPTLTLPRKGGGDSTSRIGSCVYALARKGGRGGADRQCRTADADKAVSQQGAHHG
jgi:hypothetical protein